jgi:hypothetical protein
MTTDNYPRDIDPAQKLFWEKMLESAKNTTKTNILEELRKIKRDTEETKVSITEWWGGILQGAAERRSRKEREKADTKKK